MTSPTASTITIPTRPGQPILARLQGLFPTSPTTSAHPTTSATHEPLPTPPRRSSIVVPKALKVRIVTWNMHDSVPKGDLEELLGKVPSYTAPDVPTGSFPQLPAFDGHPYHLVVIAGQECPSMLGIPMGLGAGFKLIDRERDKDTDRGERERAKERDKDYDRPRSKIPKDEAKDLPAHEGSGWTAMIEDWLCHGARQASPTPSEISVPKRLSAGPRPKERKGPYQLLIKERMMGLYLAIYIHRDLRPLVKGTSRSAVTAGLIGGRVGNKGGVGISVDLDGTTLLFINAHLAAHEGKVNHRLANFAKIKAELTVDDFLAPDDPRVMSEDLTDKFDYTFLCGDLNFRLDKVTRLHADWLISRQDYAQALTFDQLRQLMQRGTAFVGFNEAPIDFPPTFKYDVLRTIKSKRKSRSDRWRTPAERARRLTEVDEQHDLEEVDGEESDKEGEGEAEATSLSSSVWTSTHSRHGTDRDDDYFHPSPSSHAVSTFSSPGSRVSVSVSAAALKAKTKWLSLVTPASPHSPTKWLKTRQAAFTAPHEPIVATSPKEAKFDVGRPGSLESTILRPSLKRLSSTKSSLPSDEEDEGDDKGVYDTSHKKRVPSWCDRVLWKSTIQIEPESEEDESLDVPVSRPRTRMGQFFANAFRPLAAGRQRRASYSSFTSAASVATSSATVEADSSVTDSSPSSPDVAEPISPFSRFIEPQGRLSHSRSNEIISVGVKPSVPTRTLSNEATPSLYRSNSSSNNPPSPPVNRRRRATESLGSLPAGLQPHNRIATPSRWRFFPSFLSHSSTHSSSSQDPSIPTDSISPRPPRRGEVVCLNYNTLDDRGMRRLEGRSDHRPVIAAYVVYV
ncbi:inositol polyphosphate phosphatase [Mycena polygramma]|nr:inositol polyphosphate phosphatase [Mycena polygramma]